MDAQRFQFTNQIISDFTKRQVKQINMHLFSIKCLNEQQKLINILAGNAL